MQYIYLFYQYMMAYIYFKAKKLVLRARSESVGFAEIENKDRMVGTKAFMPFRVQRHKGTE